MTDAAARRPAAPDAGARLCVGAADRGLDRHRQPGAGVRAGGAAGGLCARCAVAAGARRGRRRRHARRHACVDARAGAVRGAAITAIGSAGRRVHGGGLPALLLAWLGWAALTALASGVVRSLRLAQSAVPAPPIAAASLGALCAGLLLGDLADLRALSVRLAAFVVRGAPVLVLLQRADRGASARAGLPRRPVRLFAAGLAGRRVARPAAVADAARRPRDAADDGRACR